MLIRRVIYKPITPHNSLPSCANKDGTSEKLVKGCVSRKSISRLARKRIKCFFFILVSALQAFYLGARFEASCPAFDGAGSSAAGD